MALWNKVKKGLFVLLCIGLLGGCGKKVEPGEVISVTSGDILTMIENKETFVVYMGQTTCPHCQDYAPIIDEVCEEKGATIYKVMLDLSDPENNMVFVQDYGLEYTPTTFYFEEGEMITSFVGNVTTKELTDFLKKYGQL